MRFLNLDLAVNYAPELDKGFVPLGVFFAAHQKKATKPFAVALKRGENLVSVYETKVIGTDEYLEADRYYVERLVKFLLWARGGYSVSLCGDEALGNYVKDAYTETGTRAFDKAFMQRIFGKEFEVHVMPYGQKPAANEAAEAVGRNLAGCRIGFDAGGSDRKVSAVINGEAVYSEEVVWFPKENTDPAYHFEGIVNALKTAASKMPKVDAIGVSSAGVYVDNICKVASLFIKVNDDDFKKYVENIYLRARDEIDPNIPITVANDGDVTALAGAMGMGENAVMGIAMGTSEAAGYVDAAGNVTGWLNELAFAPVDGQADAMRDEWSGDIGCGVKYFSQDGVIKLAGMAGIKLTGQSPAEKLKEVQKLMAEDDETAAAIYRSIGSYLGYTLGLYAMFYNIKHLLLMGRVMSGKGGDILLAEAQKVLAAEFPEAGFSPAAPDEKARRVGQSVAAASL